MLYAKALDLYPYGYGDLLDAKVALVYYQKAADKNLAEAEHLLYNIYRYGYMDMPTDYDKALHYLNRYILHSDLVGKAYGYHELASLYYNGEISEIKKDTSLAIYYLEKALTYDSTNGRVMDFLSSIYIERGEYDKAIPLMLATDNETQQVEVACWMIEGNRLKKNIAGGVALLHKAAEKIITLYGWGNLQEYPVDPDYNAVYVLNKLFYCKKTITKEQIGKYLLKTWLCD